MKEQFVTYKISLALKELGFNKECLGYYRNLEEFYITENGKGYNYNKTSWFISAPLWQQAIDWLEKKGYYINLTRVFQFAPKPIKFEGWCIHMGTNNPEVRLDCNNYYINNFYSTKKVAREQAIFKAIELCQKKN